MPIRFIIMLVVLAFMAPVTVGAQANDSFKVGQQIGFDSTAPTIPDNVALEPVASTQIDVTWDASYDFIGVLGYEIWRDGSGYATVTAPTTSYSDTGLTPFTLYEYIVRAYDLAGNYSNFSTSTATTTLAVPPTPTPTTTPVTPSSGSTGTFIGFSSFQITAETYQDRIDLTLSARSPFRAIIRYGTTHDGEEGTLSLETYRRLHHTTINGLSSDTSYTITVIATDGNGYRIERTLTVRTTSGDDDIAPTNPKDFTASPLSSGIRLSWNNPEDSDFSVVRIMRMEGTLPIDPYDGELIYEGAREGYQDREVAAGRQYGYAIFARDRAGNYSSGAIAFVRAYDSEGIGEAGIMVPETGTTTHDLSPFIRIEQAGTVQTPIDGRFMLDRDAPFTLSIKAEAFPRVLKTIVVTLSHPRDTKQTFSFLLRSNEAKDQYLARIGALIEKGEYRATISVLDLSSKTIMTDHFTIEAIDLEAGAQTQVEVGESSRTLARLMLIAVALLLIAFAAIRMWHRGTDSARYNDGY